MHDEHRILIGDGSVKENIGEPLHRSQTPAAFEPQFLFAVDNQQRIARNGVERFDAAADEYRNLSELGKIDIVLRGFGRQPVRRDPTHSEK